MSRNEPDSTSDRWFSALWLDRSEQAAIIVLWGWLVWRVVNSPNPFAPLVIVSETSVMIFVLFRRSTLNISYKLSDWVLAITATCAPLLIVPSQDPVPMIAPLAIVLWAIGTVAQLTGKLFLRRSFGIAPANRGIKTGGMYRFVRHPIYAGYLLAHVGALLLIPSLWNLSIYAVSWAAQIPRILAEERLLSLDAAYRDYMGKTRWRLIPGVF